MISLLVVAFAAGLATALSPCVLPILPVVAATSGAGGRRRPLGMAAGLVLTFTIFTLTAARVLDALGLPDDALRTLGIALLALAGIALLVPAVAELAGRPFQPLARAAGRRVRGGDGFAGGVAIGAALGLVWTPCAGPVLAAVSVLAANQDVSARVVAITLAYAFGAALPLLGIALAGQRATARIQALRAHGPALRRAAGAIMVAAAALFATDVPERLAVALPGYTSELQAFERSNGAQDLLDDLTGAKGLPVADQGDASLRDFGVAPGVAQIASWINTPGDRPLAADDFAGRVVLVDFWTYSCINCLRTLPYLTAWDARYRKAGLTILGVHTPEFAFERDRGNVERAVREHGIRYPVALDSEYGTWNAWGNRYWPAKYLIDRRGHVRFYHFGEGDYDETERAIRTLLGERGATATPGEAQTPSPDIETPETYLGAERAAGYVQAVRPRVRQRYELPQELRTNEVGLGGEWTVGSERAVAGRDAVLELRYRARRVFLVLAPPKGGRGSVDVSVDGAAQPTVASVTTTSTRWSSARVRRRATACCVCASRRARARTRSRSAEPISHASGIRARSRVSVHETRAPPISAERGPTRRHPDVPHALSRSSQLEAVPERQAARAAAGRCAPRRRGARTSAAAGRLTLPAQAGPPRTAGRPSRLPGRY